MTHPALPVFAICLGACVGALARWRLGLWLSPGGLLPWGTLAANLLGGYLVGVCVAGFEAAPGLDPVWRLLLVTGLLVITRWHVPGIAAALLVGIFAVFHGLAHGYELAGGADAAMTLAGMLTATVLLHVTGLALGWVLRSANIWIPRLAGAGVAIFGVTLLAQLA